MARPPAASQATARVAAGGHGLLDVPGHALGPAPPPVDQHHDGGQARTVNTTRTESAFLRGWKRSPAPQPGERGIGIDMGAFGSSAHALFVTVGHSRPGRGVKRDGRQASGCRRQPVFGPRAGARAGVTAPGRGAGATAGRTAAANTRATQVQLLEASNTNSERQAYRNRQRLVRRLHRVCQSRWSHLIGGGDTLPASSHNVNGS